jgi:hypothetical protein
MVKNKNINKADMKMININYFRLKKEIFKTNAAHTKIVSIVQFQNVNGIKMHQIKINKDTVRD